MTGQSRVQTSFIACNLCEAICGLEIKRVNNSIRSIRGDKLDPMSKGHICAKALALKDIYDDPDRLRLPLKKCAEGWQEIPWKQAFDEAATGLKHIQQRHGNDAVASYLGNPTVHNLEAMLFGPVFFRSLNTSNRFSATSVDQLPEQLASLLMFGHDLMIPLPDLDRTDYHLIFGANPVVSNGSLMTAPGVAKRLKAIRERGGRLVVIDPRRTETAAIADRHLHIRPGSDVYMLLAMLQVVFNEELHSLGRVGSYVDGLENIKNHVREYTPERVAALTGIAAGDVKTLVREFCAAKSASCYGRIGVSTQQYGTLSQWLINVFNIVTGNLDRAGGTMFAAPAVDVLARPRKRKGFADKFSRVRKLPDFNDEFPVATLAEEITTPGEGQIRALVTNAGNPILSTPNGRRLDDAFGKLDFMVSIDFYLNETTRHADIILPPVCALERSHYDLAFQTLAIRNGARFSPVLLTPDKKHRSDKQIFLELAWRMQTNGPVSRVKGWFKKNLRQLLGSEWVIDRQLKKGPYYKSHGLNLKKLRQNPHGIDLGALQPCLPGRLFTVDKMIRLAPGEFLNELLQIRDTMSEEQPLDIDGFDLQLIGRRDPRTNNSWLHNSQRMVKGKPRCVVFIHPKDAVRYGIDDGEEVEVTSRVGSIRIVAKINSDMMPGVVSIPHGWGHQIKGTKLRVARQHAGVNTNILTDDDFLDSVSGNAALNGVPVSVSPVAGSHPS